MNEGVVVHDPRAIIFSNPAAERILGLTSAQLRGLKVSMRAGRSYRRAAGLWRRMRCPPSEHASPASRATTSCLASIAPTANGRGSPCRPMPSRAKAAASSPPSRTSPSSERRSSPWSAPTLGSPPSRQFQESSTRRSSAATAPSRWPSSPGKPTQSWACHRKRSWSLRSTWRSLSIPTTRATRCSASPKTPRPRPFTTPSFACDGATSGAGLAPARRPRPPTRGCSSRA